MPLDLSRFGVMEHLWETLDKTPDGAHIRYQRLDIEQLWLMGFVDTQAIALEDWILVFDPYRQEDGSFVLGKEDFLALEQYRYKGEIRIPFDPMLINEGRYTDEGFDELVWASIAPSCALSRADLDAFFAALKKEFRQADGLVLIRRPAKLQIAALLEEHPSPLRNLEIMLDHMLAEKGQEILEQIGTAETDAATAQAALQASGFSSAPTTRVEEKAKGLEALAKSRKRAEPAEVEGVAKVELKKIRRSRKGMRG